MASTRTPPLMDKNEKKADVVNSTVIINNLLADAFILEEIDFVAEKKSDSSLIEQKENVFPIEIHEKFHKVILPTSNKLLKPNKILALDLDETLLDYDASAKARELILIHPEQIKQMIAYATENNIMVVCITSRKFESPEEVAFLTVRSVLNELGIDKFSLIFFTNAQSKVYSLAHLLETYFSGDFDKKQNICIVDDTDRVLLDSIAAGYPAIKALKDDSAAEYLKLTHHFLTETKPNEEFRPRRYL